MERWLLVVANENSSFEAAQQEWLKRGVFLTMVPTMEDVLLTLPKQEFMAIIVFNDDPTFAMKIPNVRRIRPNIPVICMASDYNTKSDILQTMQSVVSIARPGDLMANVVKDDMIFKQHVPFIEAVQDEKLAYKELIMYPQYRIVTFMGQGVKLSNYQFKALKLLLSHHGRVLTFYQIYDHIYGEESEPESINAAIRHIISQIRMRMNEVGRFNYIESVRGVGYRIESKI